MQEPATEKWFISESVGISGHPGPLTVPERRHNIQLRRAKKEGSFSDLQMLRLAAPHPTFLRHLPLTTQLRGGEQRTDGEVKLQSACLVSVLGRCENEMTC